MTDDVIDLFDTVPGIDGAHRGISDLYPAHRTALVNAINSGADFIDTGYYGSKHECITGRIVIMRTSETEYTIELMVKVTDDLDTGGYGHDTRVVDKDELNDDEVWAEMVMSQIETGLDQALETAETDQAENKLYNGHSIGPGEKDGELLEWLYTYIQPTADGMELEHPPGECYHEWGWEDCRGLNSPEIPSHVKKHFQTWIDSYPEEEYTELDGWVAKKWD